MIQAEGIFVGGGSDISAPIIGKDFNWTGGDGTYQVLDDGDGNWRIKFLTSGLFTPLVDMIIDAFYVAAGGGGVYQTSYKNYPGGGSGYTKTVNSLVLAANTEYEIIVGAGGAGLTSSSNASTATSGGTSSAFGSSVDGGYGATSLRGGNGGSGGGGIDGIGGTDGGNGSGTKYGTGQGTTTREFGESTGDLYATGGGTGAVGTKDADPNTGNGGDASKAGGSGIIIIRKHKEAAA